MSYMFKLGILLVFSTACLISCAITYPKGVLFADGEEELCAQSSSETPCTIWSAEQLKRLHDLAEELGRERERGYQEGLRKREGPGFPDWSRPDHTKI